MQLAFSHDRTTPVRAPAKAPATDLPGRSSKGSVLVVEDDPWNRQVLEAGFAGEGFTVATAASGREAIAQSAAGLPQLVVLDLRLPDLSAEEVVAGLRRLGTFGLLVVSALPDVHRRAATLGAAAVFRKPYDLGELLEQAEQLTAIRGASD